MWRDHPFSQRNKTTERAVGLGVACTREGGALGQNLNKEGGGDIGPLYKIGVYDPSSKCVYVKTSKKNLCCSIYIKIVAIMNRKGIGQTNTCLNFLKVHIKNCSDVALSIPLERVQKGKYWGVVVQKVDISGYRQENIVSLWLPVNVCCILIQFFMTLKVHLVDFEQIQNVILETSFVTVKVILISRSSTFSKLSVKIA